MVSVIISIGSNCGDSRASVEIAITWLKSILMQTKCSSIYQTPCALKIDRTYMNAVVSGFYQGDGFQLEDLLKDKEREMGRSSECRARGDVPVDLDIVVCDGEVLKEWDYRQKFFQIGYKEISNI